MDTPRLSSADLERSLEEAYRTRRQHHLFAYFGTGDEGVLRVQDTEVRVVVVRSELELREKLPPLGEDEGARIAFLVPWTHDLPLDISGRFALQGRVRRIGKEARLRALFGVSEVEDDARQSALVDHLLRPSSTERIPLGEGRLTLDAMWSAWLAQAWGAPTEGGLALDALLAFVAVDGRGPSFLAAMSGGAAAPARAELLSWLQRRLGPCGRVLWRAWEEGLGRRAMELALLFEPLTKSDHAAVAMWVKTKARDLLPLDKDEDVRPVVEALGREAAGASRVLERKLSAVELRAIARAADERVNEAEVRACLVESPRLPSSWTQRLDALGAALRAGAAAPTPEAARAAARARRMVEAHSYFKDAEQGHVLSRAELAVRLLSWLAARPDAKLEPSLTAHGDAEALGRWYALEGGYVDRARRGARGVALDAFGKGVMAVVDAADAARTELDRRFARGLAAWVSAGQPETQVLSIEHAVRQLAARFLEGDAERRLLVLLLDGMAWAQATELLESLGRRAAPWGPLAWHVHRDTRIGESPLPVVVAGLPTITSVSRAAFFAGKAMGPGAKLTTPDPDHWAAHPQVKKLVPHTDVPRLLLRADGRTQAGGASDEALSLVADPKRRIVALVINAIDDALKGSQEVRHDWDVTRIASLPDLLEKARDHGRAVLLASDHGHVPSDRLTKVAAATPPLGARWRAWPSASAEVAPYEVSFAGSHVYTPAGAHGVVLLSDDASCYTGVTHAGEHGGATLAEVVAPCVLIGCADTERPTDDPGQEVQAALVPTWWHVDLEEPVAPVVASPRLSKPPSKKPPKNEAQLGLPTIAPPVAVPPPVVAASPASAFASSAVLKARAPAAPDREQAVSAVEVLLARGPVLSNEAFAAAMRVLPFRVGGLISKLQEVLNLDGYEVIRHDPATRQVHLDRVKLEQLFEVKL